VELVASPPIAAAAEPAAEWPALRERQSSQHCSIERQVHRGETCNVATSVMNILD
jgi:hypothetical protein